MGSPIPKERTQNKILWALEFGAKVARTTQTLRDRVPTDTELQLRDAESAPLPMQQTSRSWRFVEKTAREPNHAKRVWW